MKNSTQILFKDILNMKNKMSLKHLPIIKVNLKNLKLIQELSLDLLRIKKNCSVVTGTACAHTAYRDV